MKEKNIELIGNAEKFLINLDLVIKTKMFDLCCKS